MDTDIVSADRLSEEAANIVENLAFRLAERNGGHLTVNHLAPYLPLSLELLETCLESMVDGRAVVAQPEDHVTEYTFTAYVDATPKAGPLTVRACVGCDVSLGKDPDHLLCPECWATPANAPATP